MYMHTCTYVCVHTVNPLFSKEVCGEQYIKPSELNFHALI